MIKRSYRFPRRLTAVLLVSLGAGTAQAQLKDTLNDTGQDTCYDGSRELVPCTTDNTGDTVTVTYPRQDGRFGRDAAATAGVLLKIGGGAAGFDFTKIANDGTELPATAALGSGPKDWACTRDNVTGRIWEVKTDEVKTDDNVKPDLRDKDWTYTWYDSTPDDNPADDNPADDNPGTPDGGVGQNSDNCFDQARCDTEKFVADVNDTGLCGSSDWRLPTRRELLSIVHYGAYNPTIDVNYFRNTVADRYWSADTYKPKPECAWYVGFLEGGSSKPELVYCKNSEKVYVRLVHNGK